MESTSSTDIEFYQDGTWEPIIETEGMYIPYMNCHPITHTPVIADKKGLEKLVIDKSAHQGDGVVLSKKSGSLTVGYAVHVLMLLLTYSNNCRSD